MLGSGYEAAHINVVVNDGQNQPSCALGEIIWRPEESITVSVPSHDVVLSILSFYVISLFIRSNLAPDGKI